MGGSRNSWKGVAGCLQPLATFSPAIRSGKRGSRSPKNDEKWPFFRKNSHQNRELQPNNPSIHLPMPNLHEIIVRVFPINISRYKVYSRQRLSVVVAFTGDLRSLFNRWFLLLSWGLSSWAWLLLYTVAFSANSCHLCKINEKWQRDYHRHFKTWSSIKRKEG